MKAIAKRGAIYGGSLNFMLCWQKGQPVNSLKRRYFSNFVSCRKRLAQWFVEIICLKVGMTFGIKGDITKIDWYDKIYDSNGKEILADWGDQYIRISTTKVDNGK